MSELQTTCCFTGHRPSKLSFGYDESHPDCVRLKERLKEAVCAMHERGVTTFLTGMALGVDLWAAEIVLRLKKEQPDQKWQLIAVIPFPEHGQNLKGEWRRRYDAAIAGADEQIVTMEQYTRYCMIVRDYYMVDQSDYVIGVYNGQPGGTRTTLAYAKKKGREIVLIDPGSPE